jgi:hypothetical protein
VSRELIHAKAHASAKQTSFRTAVSNVRSETCQKQPVPRKQLLVLGDYLHREGLPSLKPQEGKSPVKPWIARKHLPIMYCHEIATLTNAATSQSSLELSWRKMQKCESCAYINHSCLKRLLVAIVGIDSCSFSSRVKTTHGHQGINVQQARSTKEMLISFVQNNVLSFKVSPYSNIVGYGQ